MTKECDYAIRIVRSLSSQEMKSVKTICLEENMPHPFAYKILKKLENAKIVRSFRGASGGYQLTKRPDSVTMLDIVSAVDKNLYLNECLQDDYICDNNRHGKPCSIHAEMKRIQEILNGALNEKSIAELVPAVTQSAQG